MAILRYNHNTHEYIALLDEETLMHVDADHFNQCLYSDDKRDKETYQTETWLPFAGGDIVQIEKRNRLEKS